MPLPVYAPLALIETIFYMKKEEKDTNYGTRALFMKSGRRKIARKSCIRPLISNRRVGGPDKKLSILFLVVLD